MPHEHSRELKTDALGPTLRHCAVELATPRPTMQPSLPRQGAPRTHVPSGRPHKPPPLRAVRTVIIARIDQSPSPAGKVEFAPLVPSEETLEGRRARCLRRRRGWREPHVELPRRQSNQLGHVALEYRCGRRVIARPQPSQYLVEVGLGDHTRLLSTLCFRWKKQQALSGHDLR